MNTDVVVKSELFVHKQEEEAIKMGTAQHQEATYLGGIQFQGEMDSYTETLIALHVTVMYILPINSQINN